MASQYGGIVIESPQDVQARLNQERQAMFASGNQSAMFQANIGGALDALFGNPQVKQSSKIQSRINTALAGVQASEGDDDVTAELKRLSAMRDAVEGLDPALSARITQNIMQLGQVKLERDKLAADEVRAQRKDFRGEAALGIKYLEAGSTLETAAQLREQREAEGTNYWRKTDKGIERVNVESMDSLERRRLRKEGWVEGVGPTTEEEAKSIFGTSDPTKPVLTDLQTNLLQAREQLDNMSATAEKFNPAFLTLPTAALMAADKLYSRVTGQSMTPEIAATRAQFTEFRRNAVDSFNRYIKFITGAQMAVAEAERIQKGFPDAERDDPVAFLAKLRGVAKQTLAAEKRAVANLRTGIPVNAEQMEACRTPGKECVWDNMKTPAVSDAEVDQFLLKFGIPVRGGGTGAAAPAAGNTRQDRINRILNAPSQR